MNLLKMVLKYQTIKYFLGIIVLSLFFITVNPAYAFECETINVQPASGTPETEFIVTASNCTADLSKETPELGYFSTIAVGGDGIELPNPTQWNLNGDPQIVARVSGLIQNGTYNISIVYKEGIGYEDVAGTTTIQISGGSDTGLPGYEIECGGLCRATDTCDLCKPECPAQPVTNAINSPWRCGEVDTTAPSSVAENCGGPNVSSAIGCLPYEALNILAKNFLAFGISISGGVALLLIVYSGIMYITSSGSPQRVEAAKSIIYSVLGGLFLILLATAILQFLGVNLLTLFSG